MMRRSDASAVFRPLAAAVFASVFALPSASAQDDGAVSDPGAGAPTVQVVPVPASTPQVVVPGYPQPGENIDGHLPSSSQARSDVNSADGFDLGGSGEGAGSIKGKAGGSYVTEGSSVPESHSVRRGDTLWDISGRYYKSPYFWPRIWAYNPQISNPHWIYPGDRVQLRDRTPRGGGLRWGGQGGAVPPQTVFMRSVGWVADPDDDAWGDLIGAHDDQMLLSYGDDVYIQLDEDREVQIGQELTLYRPLRKLRQGDEDSDTELVSVRGTVRVDRYNPNTKMLRARITEALDVIERGELVAPIQRKFEVVPPVRNEKDVEAAIIASLYPYRFFGKDQVVFLDKGEDDGVVPGNRFFAIRRGDRWVHGLKNAGEYATLRARVEDDRPSKVDDTPLHGDDDDYPDETYAELRVLSVRKDTCMAVVTASIDEVERDAYLLARKGY